MRKFLIFSWRPEVHANIFATGDESVYVLDRQLLSTDFVSAVSELKLHGLNYVVLNDANSMPEVFALIGWLKEEHSDISEVLNFDEKTQYAAALIKTFLLSKLDDARTLIASRDKREMKNLLNRKIKMAEHQSVQTLLSSKSTPKSFPLVLKPVNRLGSSGVKCIRDLNEWNAEVSELEKQSISPIELITEEFINGNEYHVDTVWCEGKQKYLFIGKYLHQLLEGYTQGLPDGTIYLTPSDNVKLFNELTAVNLKAGTTLGVIDGVTHAEYFESEDGWVLGEIAYRPIGGAGGKCVRALVGEDLVSLAMRQIVKNFQNEPSSKYMSNQVVGFVDLRPHRSGIIKEVCPKETLLKFPGVIDVIYRVRIGFHIEKSGRDSWCVIVILRGNNRSEIIDTMTKLQDAFWCEFDD